MVRITFTATILILVIGVISCSRIKNKTEQVAGKVKAKVANEFRAQTQKVIDEIHPPFDHDKPDTENNRKRFVDFLKVEITPDIKHIYCFDDAIGINADYMFAFHCSKVTSEKIIETHHLTIDSLQSDNGFGIQSDFEWWDKEIIKNLQKYSWTDGNQYFKYYWYDEEHGKAYFFDFDI